MNPCWLECAPDDPLANNRFHLVPKSLPSEIHSFAYVRLPVTADLGGFIDRTRTSFLPVVHCFPKWESACAVSDDVFSQELSLKAVADVRNRLDVVVPHAELVAQGIDVLVDQVLRHRVGNRADRLGNGSTAEGVVGAACQK